MIPFKSISRFKMSYFEFWCERIYIETNFMAIAKILMKKKRETPKFQPGGGLQIIWIINQTEVCIPSGLIKCCCSEGDR